MQALKGAKLGLMVERQRSGRAPLIKKLPSGRSRWSSAADLGWYDVLVTSAAAPCFSPTVSGRSDHAGVQPVATHFLPASRVEGGLRSPVSLKSPVDKAEMVTRQFAQ
jgi:hypothetical protein